MSNTLRNVAALLACLFACTAYSQTYGDYAAKAGENMLLYRGSQAVQYRKAHNGNPYWYSPEFKEGSLVYNGKEYFNVKLNIDAASGQLLILHPNGVSQITLYRNLVESFTIDGKEYFNLRKQGHDVQEGFYEMMLAADGGIHIYRRIDKILQDDIRYHNQGSGDYEIGYYDPNYKRNVHPYFYNKESFLVIQPGKILTARNRKALASIFRKNKELRRTIENL